MSSDVPHFMRPIENSMLAPDGENVCLGDITLRHIPSIDPHGSEESATDGVQAVAAEIRPADQHEIPPHTVGTGSNEHLWAFLRVCRGPGVLDNAIRDMLDIWVDALLTESSSECVHTVVKCLSIAETTRSFTTIISMARLIQEVHRRLPASDRTSLPTATMETLRLNLSDVVASALREVADNHVESGLPGSDVRRALIDAIDLVYRTSDLMLEADLRQYVELGVGSFGRWMRRSCLVPDWSPRDFAELLDHLRTGAS